MTMAASGPRKMLVEDQILDIIPFSRSTLLRMEKAGTFPRSTYISSNRRVWFEDEITEWQNTVNEFKPGRKRGRPPAAVKPPQINPDKTKTA